jgi:hypothetical protein
MTVAQIQAIVAGRLNLTSATALSRIVDSINERHSKVCSDIGLQTSTQTTISATTTIGVRSLVFQAEKLYSVYNPAYTPVMVLDEESYDYLLNEPVGTDPPTSFAIQNMNASSVTIFLSSVPSTAYALTAQGMVSTVALTTAQTPLFAADFHDILTYWAMGVELDKMEKYDMAAKQETLSDNRLSDLRFFLAKSAYKDIYQGKNAVNQINVPLA